MTYSPLLLRLTHALYACICFACVMTILTHPCMGPGHANTARGVTGIIAFSTTLVFAVLIAWKRLAWIIIPLIGDFSLILANAVYLIPNVTPEPLTFCDKWSSLVLFIAGVIHFGMGLMELTWILRNKQRMMIINESDIGTQVDRASGVNWKQYLTQIQTGWTFFRYNPRYNIKAMIQVW